MHMMPLIELEKREIKKENLDVIDNYILLKSIKEQFSFSCQMRCEDKKLKTW